MKVYNWERERQSAILESVWALKQGLLVVYPTDTLYGLAADPAREECVIRVNEVKGRPVDWPISICIPNLDWLEGRTDPRFVARARELLPGPVTLLMPIKERIAAMGSADTLGVRLVEHPVVKELTERFGIITTTSANRHDHDPPTTCEEAVKQLGESVEVYIDAGPVRVGRASKIISLVDDSVLRD
ncbi:MAG TPA: L-threonylcarbamoyladenylate synthase [Thermoplasmata archaeon]|nr:L-threonylcarbamoyladenylate synthase [Thermoplasmata archaeon]